jgi:hypothetical protein
MVQRYTSRDDDGLSREAGAASAGDAAANLTAVSTLLASVKARLTAMQAQMQARLESLTLDGHPLLLEGSGGADGGAVGSAPGGLVDGEGSPFETGEPPVLRFRSTVDTVRLLNRANQRFLAHKTPHVDEEVGVVDARDIVGSGRHL